MRVQSNAPIIIKRKKVIASGGHHGGAWKVAYADFVTAMMAFFMLMWLLNATTENQRKGIADYFSPTIPINRVSGGGDGMFGGASIFSQEILAQNGYGGTAFNAPDVARLTGAEADQAAAAAAQVAALRDIEETLLGRGGESMLSEKALRHIVTRLTDEGLIIEIFDLPDARLFVDDTAVPTEVAIEITATLARVFALVQNPVAISGHTAARSVVVRQRQVWTLSTDRAEKVRQLFEIAGFPAERVARLTGFADRQPAVANGTAIRNNRIEIVLLRSDM